MSTRQRILLGLTSGALAWLAMGCGPERIHFADSVDVTFDLTPFVHGDELHQPYVRGAELSIWVLSRWADEDFSDWEIEIADESVMELLEVDVEPDDTNDMRIGVRALAEGETELRLYRPDGKLVTTAPLEVAVPDNVLVKPHGPMIIGRDDLVLDDHEFQVLDGGMATFLVRWFRGNEQLYGHGTLEVDTPGDIDVDVRQTFLFEDRDWIQVVPDGDGDKTVVLYSDGEEIDDVRIERVTDGDVTDIRLHAEPELLIERGARLEVLAEGYSDDDRPIYGIEFDWSVDGDLENETGDLFRYEFDPDEEQEISILYGGMEDSVVIHGEGYVSSTNIIGCSAASGRPTGAGAMMTILGLVGLVGVLRRRI